MQNKEWVFSGVGLSIISAVFVFIFKRKRNEGPLAVVNVTNHIENAPITKEKDLIDDFKTKSHILFVDDDPKFQVVTILKKSGWINTKRVKDIYNIDDVEVKNTNIFFVDIQGVGVALGFKDEGLGLALALKNKYPEKKVIIYSAESKGDRFHQALRKADSFLPKNAEPYEFQQLVEDYSKESFSK